MAEAGLECAFVDLNPPAQEASDIVERFRSQAASQLPDASDRVGYPGLRERVYGDAHRCGPQAVRLMEYELLPNVASVSARDYDMLLCSLAAQYDFIIIDTAPVQRSPEALAVAQGVSGVMIVVAAGRTTQRAVKRTIASFVRVDAPVLGVVLNFTSNLREAVDRERHEARHHKRRFERVASRVLWVSANSPAAVAAGLVGIHHLPIRSGSRSLAARVARRRIV